MCVAPDARAPETAPCRGGGHPRFAAATAYAHSVGGGADPKHLGTARGLAEWERAKCEESPVPSLQPLVP
eukprot:4483239-Pyramimonas_sp.AAC.1